MHPLVVPVEVHPYHIDDVLRAAKLGLAAAQEHVPGMPLAIVQALDLRQIVLAPRARDDVDPRLNSESEGARRGCASGTGACDGGAHHLALQLVASVGSEGVYVSHRAAGPGNV